MPQSREVQFVRQEEKVKALQAKLKEEIKKLQLLCNHKFGHSVSFSDCKHCGLSEYYLSQGHDP